MKLLSNIIKNIEVLDTHGNVDVSISAVSLSNKDIVENSLFVAIQGHITDGHNFISDVISKGAKVIVHQTDLSEYHSHVAYVKVRDTKEAVGIISHNFYNHPSFKIKLVGVTGTNGKTTVATLLHQLFNNLGHKSGLISTVGDKIGDNLINSNRTTPTTPDAITLNNLLSTMVDAGCEYCFMEASSHSVAEKRISGLSFAGGIFTNLTHDHLDYHGDFENYLKAKKAFFDGLNETSFALSNIDDESGETMLSDTKAKKHFYGFKKSAEFNSKLESRLIGEFNMYNILAVYGASTLLGISSDRLISEIKKLDPVEGRFNYFKSESGITGIVDYAHSPDALDNALKTTLTLAQGGLVQGRVITVVGCGGDRDKTKRPIMAQIAYSMSDIVILTSDNPRSEKIEDILADMRSGLPEDVENVYIMPDRRDAIKKACEISGLGDYILVAGKGHEKYQEINGVKNHFDDMEELRNNLK
jgi:UDP-N-acetylmuramoyl-L-alanyl-D-glutamate--2,6-diaminopimelate ligase